MSSQIPDLLKPVSWLEGSWITESGQGVYPSIKPFTYCERLQFKFQGQPMLVYSSDSWHPEKLTPMHIEKGFLRVKPGTNQLALMASHNFGLTTLEEGECINNSEIKLKSCNISRMTFSKEPGVKSIEKTFTLMDDGKLQFIMCMETDNTPMTEHLRAVYTKENVDILL